MIFTIRSRRVAWLVVTAVSLGASRLAVAQSTGDPVSLTVERGTPLSIALDESVRIRRVGQTITGFIVNPLYAYDRIVVPPGTKVSGHVAQLKNPTTGSRVRAALGGDFTPARNVELEFDTLVLGGSDLPIHTIVTGEQVNVTRLVAGGATAEASENAVVARARDEVAQVRESVKQSVKSALSAIKQPGKVARLKRAVMSKLPYHRQFLAKGTVYTARLTSALDFGSVPSVERAGGGAWPAPGSILNARLLTPLDSAKTPRGSAVVAVITEPMLSSDGRLIVPAGTEIRGTVTFAKEAGRFHRNGRLRFLFESVTTPAEAPTTLLASLYSVQASADLHIALDDEGGATMNNPKTRFVTPALAVVMLGAAAYQPAEASAESAAEPADLGGVSGGYAGTGGSGAVGGFLGLGLAGAALSQVSRPIGLALATVGVARTFYTNIFGKGHEMSFPADTPIEIQVAPGSTAAK